VAESLHNISENLNKIHSIIKENRSSDSIKIIAVSKGQSLEKIQQALDQDITNFGENYLQEAKEKIIKFQEEKNIQWHFIGKIQSNKLKEIAQYFDWIQSVSKLEHIDKLDYYANKNSRRLNILLQLSQSKDRLGFSPEQIFNILKSNTYQHINIRGMMFLPSAGLNHDQLNNEFQNASSVFYQVKSMHHFFDTLSMGMSSDFELAIRHGSNMLRLGTIIFGDRNYDK
jgi:pyridoxal phosphate enzyme (YggS family)